MNDETYHDGRHHGACVHGTARPCCRHAGGAGQGALVEPAALAALLGGAAHGYDLRRAIGELTNGQLDVDPGGLYRVLRRLETEGFVVSEWAGSGPGPQRRNYELSEEGRDLAEGWVVHLRERERLSGLLADVLTEALAKEAPTE
ncbi:MAG: PadR family transcriptional regulator [Coriobacteriales bacterium]|nr:PadR family transcriptional regulator [Actinomycetes bacterium]